MIKNKYIEGEYLIYEYESGAIVKTLISQETEGQVIELPKNPLIQLQEENKELKNKINLMQKALDELTLGGI